MRTKMHSDPLYWLKNLLITAREDDEEEDEGQNDEGNDDGEEEQEQGKKSDDESDSDDDFKDDQGNIDWEAKAKAQEEALKKERRLRRRAERDARRAAKKSTGKDDNGQQDEADSKVDDKIRRKLETEQQRSRRLAEGFRKREIDAAIEAEARRQRFIDPTDALLDEIRDEVDYEQDKDDPSRVEIDMDSVREAVEDLADRKKHLLDTSEEPKPKSGGKFRRKSGSRDDEKGEAEVLQDRYPSLR